MLPGLGLINSSQGLAILEHHREAIFCPWVPGDGVSIRIGARLQLSLGCRLIREGSQQDVTGQEVSCNVGIHHRSGEWPGITVDDCFAPSVVGDDDDIRPFWGWQQARVGGRHAGEVVHRPGHFSGGLVHLPAQVVQGLAGSVGLRGFAFVPHGTPCYLGTGLPQGQDGLHHGIHHGGIARCSQLAQVFTQALTHCFQGTGRAVAQGILAEGIRRQASRFNGLGLGLLHGGLNRRVTPGGQHCGLVRDVDTSLRQGPAGSDFCGGRHGPGGGARDPLGSTQRQGIHPGDDATLDGPFLHGLGPFLPSEAAILAGFHRLVASLQQGVGTEHPGQAADDRARRGADTRGYHGAEGCPAFHPRPATGQSRAAVGELFHQGVSSSDRVGHNGSANLLDTVQQLAALGLDGVPGAGIFG